MTDHPAKFTPAILDVVKQQIDLYADTTGSFTILDPFGGVGGIHALPFDTYAIELEHEWSALSEYVGWSACMDFFDYKGGVMDGFIHQHPEYAERIAGPKSFDAIVTSCTYGNRMADKHTVGAADKSKRLTYKHRLGRDLSPNNSGGMQWGDEYRTFHRKAWRHADTLLKPGGLFVLNVKDHIRKGKLMRVADWHRMFIEFGLDYELLEDVHVGVRGMGFGANQQTMKVDYEHVYVFRKRVE